MAKEKILDMNKLKDVSGGKEIYKGKDNPQDPSIDLTRIHKKLHKN